MINIKRTANDIHQAADRNIQVRSAFGRQTLFCEQGPELCDSVSGDAALRRLYGLRNPVHQPTQHAPCFAQHRVNTRRTEYTTTGTNHAEGGWPKDVNVVDPEATQRYRRRVEKEDAYIHCVMTQAAGMEHYVLQNNAVDLYRSYYSEMSGQPERERPGARTLNVYRDAASHAPAAAAPARSVTSLCWHTEGTHFSTTYCDVDFNRNSRASVESYIWDLENANNPVVVFTPTSALLDLQQNPRHPHTHAGGMIDGRVALWDQRQGGAAVGGCPAHEAHRDLVRSVLYVSSKSGREFFSGGPDGACKWWDSRNLSGPTDEMILDVVNSPNVIPSMATANGVSALEFEPTMPTRFMAGTENGLVLAANRKGKTALEKIPVKYEAHLGPVWSVERNPSFLKNFLTVGDWTLRVWSEECHEHAVLWSPPGRHRVAAAAWSPTRLSLVVALQADGSLTAWDLLRRQHEPTLTVRVCAEPLLRVRMHPAGALVACGSSCGRVYLVELSPHLAQSGVHDKSRFTAVLERESRRERILEARVREARLRLRQVEGDSPAASEVELPTGDRDLERAAAEYWAQVKKELAAF